MDKPIAIVVDTNLISGEAKQDLPDTELEALQWLYNQPTSNVTTWATTNSMGELNRIPQPYRQDHLDIFDKYRPMPGYPSTDPTRFLNVDDVLSTAAGAATYKSLGFLPDETDRRLLAATAQIEASFFATCDRKTILSHTAEIESLTSVRPRLPSWIAADLGWPGPSKW